MYDINYLVLQKCTPIGAANLRPQFAQMCGTCVTQIERTYWRLNDGIRLSSTLANYKRESSGSIEEAYVFKI